MQPNFYLFFQGDCFEAMSLYAETLGGEITSIMRNKDAPDDESRMPGGDDLVMNMQMTLGPATIMASDTPDAMYDKPQGFRIQIEPPSLQDFERIFDILSKDARDIQMPPGEMFWAERFALFTDRFGTPWMLNYEGKKAIS